MATSRYSLLLHRLRLASAVLLVLVTFTPDLITALRNVHVHIPTAVKRGDNALLICNYDIENDTLYSVKWYRGRREFYRYTPKEVPAWKIFPTSNNGIAVETSQSNASHVFLRHVPLSISGKYTCEVSADAPNFHTSIAAAQMEIVEMPTQRPIITGIHSRYRLGDVISGNCSSDYSKPAANLTWWINDIQVPPNYLRTFDVQKHLAENLESSVLEINFFVTLQHFIKSRMKLKCSARIHNVYHQETEKLVEEDRPRILASGRSPDMNIFPFDQPGEGNDGLEQNELYLTHYTNAASGFRNRLKLPFGDLLMINQGALMAVASVVLPAFALLIATSLPRNIFKADTHRNAHREMHDDSSFTSAPIGKRRDRNLFKRSKQDDKSKR